MPTNRKLFMPGDGLNIRSPTTNEKRHGNIMNPRRYAEFGGMSSANPRGLVGDAPSVQTPESTQRRYPVKG
jgi:hypothetical protein